MDNQNVNVGNVIVFLTLLNLVWMGVWLATAVRLRKVEKELSEYREIFGTTGLNELNEEGDEDESIL